MWLARAVSTRQHAGVLSASSNASLFTGAVCTIHQPSIDIFEAFDELLLLKRGGETIYCGPLGEHSVKLISYFSVSFQRRAATPL